MLKSTTVFIPSAIVSTNCTRLTIEFAIYLKRAILVDTIEGRGNY